MSICGYVSEREKERGGGVREGERGGEREGGREREEGREGGRKRRMGGEECKGSK